MLEQSIPWPRPVIFSCTLSSKIIVHLEVASFEMHGDTSYLFHFLERH
jgi:hypothetical protein